MKSTKAPPLTIQDVVAPFAGAWIEMRTADRGPNGYHVAPFAGAWIEITITTPWKKSLDVAPFAGAWIEIEMIHGITAYTQGSLPSRERGLKLHV